jgi:ribA/ribD-fused uncharacterized protein
MSRSVQNKPAEGLTNLVPSSATHGLDTDTQVFFYERDFYVLSNFSAFTLRWRGTLFHTSEAAYQAEKFVGYSTSIYIEIASAPSAHEAFKIAERKRDARNPEWDDVKVGVMRNILRAKVGQHEYVRRKLLATGDRELIEDSWRDDVWGWGPNRDGQNLLGRLWMEIRAEIGPEASGTFAGETTLGSPANRKNNPLPDEEGKP